MLDKPTPIQLSATLLLVDDEPNVTNALRRALRNRPYRILTAQNGVDALRLMEENTVNLVVSDARMPGMDGATLLAEICERWPACIRILLTGYADIDATIKAINDGKIYRYLSKPWHDDELCLVLEQSLAYQYAEQERLRLLQLTREQNDALQDVNESLERRVRERTTELASTAQLLERVNTELKRSYVTATEVFSSLINQRLPKSRQTNQEIIALIGAYCRVHKLPEKDVCDLEMAAALYNVGKLTWRDELIAIPSDRLQKEQRERYREYPGIGEKFLMALDPAQDAAVMIRHHQERWDGAGFPDGLSGEAIPWGARLIKLAVDAVEMQMGMVQARQLTRGEALTAIAKSAGRLYDPLLSEEFVKVALSMSEDLSEQDNSILVLGTLALESGMIMMKKLYSAAGTLLLSEGKVLSQRLIDRVREFEHSEGVSYTLYMQRPGPDTCDE